ncbi:hypothetical protein BTVI_65386 [Pitangus sulphuratus]|nr:hypothetical protein BTVI_65386 [Pitangus sulphuratus]
MCQKQSLQELSLCAFVFYIQYIPFGQGWRQDENEVWVGSVWISLVARGLLLRIAGQAVKGSRPINLAQLPLLFPSYSVSPGVPVSKLIELEVPPGARLRIYGFMRESGSLRPQKRIRAPVEKVKKCLEMTYSPDPPLKWVRQ